MTNTNRQTFTGFRAKQARTIRIHGQFFTEVLPQIDHLAALKVVLFCYYALTQRDGTFRYLTREDFTDDAGLMRGLAVTGDDPQQVLDEGLARAVQQGILLRASADDPDRGIHETLYFLNSEQGQEAVRQLEAGHWVPDAERVVILPERPTIFELYEANIGTLTPMIVDELKEADEEFKYEWIEEAIKQAVVNDARSWRYVRTVLDSWKQEGRIRRNHENAQGTHRGSWLDGKSWTDLAK